jgi:hypothetical protein
MNDDPTAHNQGKDFEDFENSDNSKPAGFIHESEDDRLIRDMNRSPMEKLMLFTQMIRRERMYKQGRISESDDIQNPL